MSSSSYAAPSNVNKDSNQKTEDSGHKVKAKDSSHKTKAKDSSHKPKVKDLKIVPQEQARPSEVLIHCTVCSMIE